MAARFSFKLSDAGLSVTIYKGGVLQSVSIIDNGDGTYYTTGLSSGVYTVKVSGVAVDGLTEVPFADQDLLEHEDDASPHANSIYSKSEVDTKFTIHSSGGDHDDRYYTESEADDRFAPGDEDSGLHLPLLTSHPTVNSDNEGRLYYILEGSALVGNVSLYFINRTDYNGTAFEATEVKELHSWDLS